MVDEQKDKREYKQWVSTYGLLTASHLLERFNVHLSHEELVRALEDKEHLYYPVLRVPLKNIFNGIIFQHAYDYQVYVQRLIIDYRLSAEYVKDADQPGQEIRDELNAISEEVAELCKIFSEHRVAHDQLIAESQSWLIRWMKTQGIPHSKKMCDQPDFLEHQSLFLRQGEDESVIFRGYRTQFRQYIVRINALLTLLSEYQINEDKDIENRESLFFDPSVGDND